MSPKQLATLTAQAALAGLVVEVAHVGDMTKFAVSRGYGPGAAFMATPGKGLTRLDVGGDDDLANEFERLFSEACPRMRRARSTQPQGQAVQ